MSGPRTRLAPECVDELSDAVRSTNHVLPRGGGTKPALSRIVSKPTEIEMAGISGLVEYLPEEYTVTTYAGTTLREVSIALGENNQYFPFDPPLSEAGATVGGTVASGLSGSGRYRYGGLRDFILGVRFIDGNGRLITGGGKVVKNAAGFDFPKLMVGSLGRLGILTEVTFKVFPAPGGYATLKIPYENLEKALAALNSMNGNTIDLHALDIEMPATLCIRLGGIRDALPQRIERVKGFLGATGESLQGEIEADCWREIAEFKWVPDGWNLIKIPLQPSRLPALHCVIEAHGSQPRYCAGAALAWVAVPPDVSLCRLDRELADAGFSGLILRGAGNSVILGSFEKNAFLDRVKRALDETGRFPGY